MGLEEVELGFQVRLQVLGLDGAGDEEGEGAEEEGHGSFDAWRGQGEERLVRLGPEWPGQWMEREDAPLINNPVTKYGIRLPSA